MTRRRLSMHDALCDWFDREARDLPWRRRRSGYTALVSESMLQQTQVCRMVDRYSQFMKRFPTVRALARAEQHDVLALWQGLGYYRRARNLHAAAQMVVRDFGGRIPNTVEDLLRLPGVGRYTAGAIASIIFDQQVPIVDGNVERVLMRLNARRPHATTGDQQTWAWQASSELVSKAKRPGVFNEALMELGATICAAPPARPQCKSCPIAQWCKAQHLGLQQEIPAPRKRAESRVVHHHSVIIMRDKPRVILLEQRPSTGMWAGLWQVPTVESDSALTPDDVVARLPVRLTGSLRDCGGFTHRTTHREIRFRIYLGRSRVRRGHWRGMENLGDLPLSSAQRRVLRHVPTLCRTHSGRSPE